MRIKVDIRSDFWEYRQMLRKRIVKKQSPSSSIVNHVDRMKEREKKSSFAKATADRGKTPQLLQVPNNFSLWIAIFIAALLLLLIIAGQNAPLAAQTPVTLQLPSQQTKPLPVGHNGMKLDTLPSINQLPPVKK